MILRPRGGREKMVEGKTLRLCISFDQKYTWSRKLLEILRLLSSRRKPYDYEVVVVWQ